MFSDKISNLIVHILWLLLSNDKNRHDMQIKED